MAVKRSPMTPETVRKLGYLWRAGVVGILACPLVLGGYARWRDNIFHEGYARGAQHGASYVFYRHKLPSPGWLDAAWQDPNLNGWVIKGSMTVERWIEIQEKRAAVTEQAWLRMLRNREETP